MRFRSNFFCLNSAGIRGRPRALRGIPRGALAAVMLASQLLPAVAQTTPAAAQAAGVPAATTINNPPSAPIQILAFPQRDFVSASGYSADDRVVVTVVHPSGATFSTDPNTPVIPQDDPRAAPGAPFAGIVEVNHPGGACWFQTTPNIGPGDKVRITIVSNPVDAARVGRADETTVAAVTAARPVQADATTVKIHGTAQDAVGAPLPLAQLEQRVVANRQVFLSNGRRVLTSAKDGTLAYDAPGSINWTATYTGLAAADVTRALGAESRILWLGANPLAAVEGTVYENGAGIANGPAAPCTAPAEFVPPPPGSDATPPTNPSGLTATVTNSNTVTLSWTAATDNVGVTSYGVYRDGLAIFNVQNPDGSAPAPTTFADANVPPGTFVYTVDAADAIGNRSGLSNAVTVTATAQLAALPAGTVVNEPPVAPVQIISFPSRDFVSSSGFLPTDTVQVQVLRKVDGQPGLVVASTSTVIPQADPRAAPGAPFAGIVEVNHPGGGCWDGVTPDIRVGDVIRTIAYNPDNTIRTVDQTTTANVVAERPRLVQNASSATAADGIVQVHGVAMYHNGSPMDLAQLESRLIANRDLFVFNGRRVIRAGGAGKDGTLSYDANDPTGTHWTATYSGLVQQDVDRVLGLNGFPGSESRAIWLGVQPLAGLELTIYENAADPLASGTVNGPSAAVCFAPSEPFDTQPPLVGTLSAAQSGASSVQLSWTAATDNYAVYQYGIYEDGARIRNVGAATTSYLVNNVAPGSHNWTVDAVDTASPAAQLSPTFTYNSPWGNRAAASNAVTLAQADVTAPSVPLNLVATSGAGQVALNWSASRDDVGVTGYGVYRGGVKIADVVAPATTYTDANVAVGTYSYTVDAADAAGNRSAQSAAAIANVTAGADVTPPSTPTGLTATVPDIHLRNIALSWSAATDNVGVTGYGVYRNGSKIADLGGTVLSYSDTPASSGIYSYAVDAVDSAGNRSGQSPTASAAVANDPPLAPHSLIAFPQRDFVSNSGFALSEGPVTVSILRFDPIKAVWSTVSTSTPITPQADPKALPGDPFAGFVEVNHPGGGCWTGVTPDIRPGDILRTTTAQNISDQTTLPSITAYRPILKKAVTTGLADGVIEVHGTAFVRDAAGTIVPLTPAAFENRLIANRDLFDLNGRRVLRAGGAGSDGTLVFDAPGSINWTATYTGIDADDMARALGGTSASTGTVFVGSESRAVWLGRDPLGLTELTIYENGDGVVGGPAAGVCTTPQEPTAVSSLSAASMSFGATTTGSSSAAQTVTLSNVGGGPLHVSGVALSGYQPGDFVMESGPASTCLNATLAAATATTPGGSCAVAVHFAPTANGARTANLEFQDDAGNTPGLVTLAGTGAVVPAPVASLNRTSLAFAGQLVGSTSAAQSVTLTNTGNAPLSVASVTISGPFAVKTNTCTTLAAGTACGVSVTFTPTGIGSVTGSLSFTDNAGGSPHVVALSGSGVAQPVAAPSPPSLDAASDSGIRGDNLTNVKTPTFSGTAAVGTTVTLFADGVSVGSAATAANGTYSVTSSVLADGNHVMTAQARDGAGTLSPASAGVTLAIDTVAPVATAPVTALSAGTRLAINAADFGSSTIPVSLTWSATDANGVVSYQLQKKVDTFTLVGATSNTVAGAFADVTPAPGGASATLDLKLGQMLVGKSLTLYSYTFQVLACDAAGNCGTFASGPKFQMIPVDDSLTGPLLNGAGSVGYSGSWSVGTVPGAYNGSVHFTTATGASAKLNNVTFNVSGDVAWVTTKGPDRGKATVTVDGVAQTVDLYAPTVQPAQVVFATNGLRNGVQHQVAVAATGTANPASTGVRVDLDAFVAIH